MIKHSLVAAYGNLKIQTKLLIIIIIAVLVPMFLVFLLFSQKLYSTLSADTIRKEQVSCANTAPLITDAISSIEETSKQIQQSDFFQSLSNKPIQGDLSTFFSSSDSIEFYNSFRRYETNPLVNSIRFYVELPENDSTFQQIAVPHSMLPVSEISGTYWYGIFQGSGCTSLLCPPFYLGTREQDSYGDCAYIISTTMNVNQTILPCYLAVYFSSDTLLTLLEEHLVLDGSVSYIMNNRDAIVTTTDNTLSGIYYLTYESIRTQLLSSNNFLEKTTPGGTVYVGCYYISLADWFIVTVVPSKPLMKTTYGILFLFLVICSFCILLGILISYLLSRSLVNRILSVSHQMNTIKSDHPLPMPSPMYKDEIGDLVNSYNYMTRKIVQLMNEQKKASEEITIAQFNALQAQINPHFLYNTMDMINWLSKDGRTDDVTSAVQKLSRYYKLTLQNKSQLSTIGNELEHVSIYVSLQNMRFNNKIELVVDLSDELLDYSIPKLIFQPIIENSILHGILEKPSKSGMIVLTGWLEDNTLCILISDDGIGMTTEQLNHLFKESNTASHIAIYNTQRRLQLLYGDQYGMHYISTPQQGTEVTIRIPATL